jgi:large subunit ribosomal protein L29
MEIEKIHNLSEAELAQQKRQAAEQIFRLRFQMRMGQNDGLQKLRALKKDMARMKTVERQRQLGIAGALAASATATEVKRPGRSRKSSKEGR